MTEKLAMLFVGRWNTQGDGYPFHAFRLLPDETGWALAECGREIRPLIHVGAKATDVTCPGCRAKLPELDA